MLPELADLEVVLSAPSADGRRHPSTRGAPDLALDDLAALPARRAPHRPLLRRCWELRNNLTVDDAAYVALAETMQATLVTADRGWLQLPDPDAR